VPKPNVDLLYMAKNRLEFTRESFAALERNTNWNLIRNFVIYDDGSTDGTLEFLEENAKYRNAELRQTDFGNSVDVFGDYIKRFEPGAEFFAKVDNDAMYPPNWLDISLGVLDRHAELQLLGVEYGGFNDGGELPHTYILHPKGHIGGLFVARSSILQIRPNEPLVSQNRYWGWQEWVSGRKLMRGWLKPAIPTFVLDRVYFDPWISYTKKYEAAGWQRGWIRYNHSHDHLWEGWCPWIQPQKTA